MATDYDTPRKTDEELHEESLEELKAKRGNLWTEGLCLRGSKF